MSLFPEAINRLLASYEIPRGPNSQVYLVDPTTGVGNDNNPGTSFQQPLASIEVAEDLTVAGQNDVVLYLGGNQGNNLAAALTWDKNYTHLIGYCAPTGVANRARIFQTSTLTGASPLLNITATGCIFRNFYQFQGVDDATSLLNVQVTGGRNYFRDVHFAGGGHATQAINGGASLKLDGAEENKFVDCTIGVDTIAAGDGMVGLLFDSSAQRNKFKNCKFTMLAGHVGAAWVEVADGSGIDRYTLFEDCLFLNTNVANFEMASGFLIPAIAGNRPARMFLKDCLGYGAAKWDADDRGVLMGNMDVVTPVDLSGVAVEMVT